MDQLLLVRQYPFLTPLQCHIREWQVVNFDIQLYRDIIIAMTVSMMCYIVMLPSLICLRFNFAFRVVKLYIFVNGVIFFIYNFHFQLFMYFMLLYMLLRRWFASRL